MNALKGLVIGMAVLIVLGMGLLAYGLYHKATDPDFKLFDLSPETSPASSGVLKPGPAFGDLELPLPEGCVISDLEADGNRLYVRTAPSGPAPIRNCAKIFVIDPMGGTVLGTVSGKS